MKNLVMFAVAGIFVAVVIASEYSKRSSIPNAMSRTPDPITPNWASISAWPTGDLGSVEATPDPNRQITAIVLDDSGSMGDFMAPAKEAVLVALDAMKPGDRVAVVALNSGVVLPFTQVSDARRPLQSALQSVQSKGRTPLTSAVGSARQMLETEAAAARSFGTYRVIITTDGQADDGAALTGLVENIAETTPIQLATIGIDILGNHVLRRDDLGSFVDVDNIQALAGALQDAIAENAEFDAVTNFDGGN